MFRAIAAFRWATFAAILIAVTATTMAEEEPPKPSKDTKEEKADLYAVPETKEPKELMDFIKKIMEFSPKTRAEAREYNEKSPPAVKKAAELILELDEEGKSKEAGFAKQVLLQMRVMQLGDASPEEQQKIFEEVRDYIAAKEEPERSDFSIAAGLAQRLEAMGSPSAADAYETFGELLAKNDSEQIAEHGKVMLGAARRLKLVGNAMEISGDTVDGKAFELADWKGKVVLVDFWATWCGPCVQEIPHVKEMYEKYHEKGFEVVGISLDQDRPALDMFLKEKSLPWTILHQNDGSGNHPAAVHYGIVAIPFMALLDREGKVISIEARGEELTKLLEEQFEEKN